MKDTNTQDRQYLRRNHSPVPTVVELKSCVVTKTHYYGGTVKLEFQM